MINQFKKTVEIIRECIETFRNYSEDGINQFVDETDGSLSFPKELSDVVEKFIEALKSTSNISEDFTFLDELYNEQEQKFWDVVKEFINNRRNAKNEILFIKNLNKEDFIDLFNFVFGTYILEYNELKEYKSFTEENIIIVIKVINTLIKMVIDNFYSKVVFEKATVDLLGLSTEQIEYIWDLIIKNKQDLKYIRLMRRLERLEER